MSFIVKKKKFKFKVSFEVEELSSVPFISGILFCKVRQKDGGSFTDYSTKEEVCNHVVVWKARYEFQAKLMANTNTGVLETTLCRVSVRKESKGGRSFDKLGYADVNLSEFAGCGFNSRRYILDGYNSTQRQDNSVLKINIEMSLQEGYPMFKVPVPKTDNRSDDVTGMLSSKRADPVSDGSLTRKNKSDEPLENPVVLGLKSSPPEGDTFSLARTSSEVSGQSKVSGHSSSHSRNNSDDITHISHRRSASSGSHSSTDKRPSTKHKVTLDTLSSIEARVDSTRVSAEDLVNQLIAQTDFAADDSAETSGLQLYVGKDGEAVVGGRRDRSQIAAGHLERVVIGK